MASIEIKALCLKIWHELERVATSAPDNVVNSTWYPLIVYPEMDSSLSIMDILEVGVIREDDKGIEPETEEEKTRVPST